MRALFLRFYKFTGPLGLVMVIGGILLTPLAIIGLLSDGGGPSSSYLLLGKAFVLAIVAITGAIMAATNYERSSHTISYEDILLPLVQSECEYCLVLRPFGRDGQVIIPQANHKGRVGLRFTSFTKNITMEQLVATAARKSLDIETYGIVDQDVLFAPPGVTFIRASNDEWRTVVQRLIRRAHTIVLILHPSQEIRGGFAWEIEQIVRYGMQSRVIIALPPSDNDGHQDALAQACVIFALLDDSGQQADLNQFKVYEYQLLLSPTTLLARHQERGGLDGWEARTEDGPEEETAPDERRKENRKKKIKNKGKTIVGDGTYLPGFVEMFKNVEQELSEWSFETRYPLK
jgi:hypothetical protein